MGTRHLHDVPVLSVVAFSDHKIYVVWKIFWILIVKAPLKVMVAIQKFARSTVRNADLPNLPAVPDRFPFELSKIKRFSRLHRQVGPRKFAKNPVGDGVKRVFALANFRNGELAVTIAAHPEFIIFGVVLPIDFRSSAS